MLSEIVKGRGRRRGASRCLEEVSVIQLGELDWEVQMGGM